MPERSLKDEPIFMPQEISSGLFAWVKPAFKSRRTVKTWIRCVVAFAATMILMVSRKTSDTMGQAAFFCVIVAVMLPPTLAFSVFLVASFTLLLGMLLGWAWGNAAMAAALAARSSALLAQQQQNLRSSIDPNGSIDLQSRLFAFHGGFLDPRSSTVYGVFLFIGAFVLGAVRAYLPNFTILCIFGTIVLDVICTTGPLLPAANYTLAKLFILPASFYVAIALASLVLVFPESLSHVWLASLTETFWSPVLDILRLQSEILSLRPSDVEAWSQTNARGIALREKLIAASHGVATQIKLMNLDVSIGRLGPSDLKRINAELKSVMFHASALHSFSTFVNDINLLEEKELKLTPASSSSTTGASQPPNPFRTIISRTKERELIHGHDLDSLVPILQAASARIRASMGSTLLIIINWFQESNSGRLSGLFKRVDDDQIQKRRKQLVDQLTDILTALEEFKQVERKKLIQPYERFFDPETKLMIRSAEMFASRTLYVCLVFMGNMEAFAEQLVDMLKIIIDIDAQRRTSKVWFPGRISSVKENIAGNDFGQNFESPFGMGTSADPAAFDSPSNSRDDLDSTPYEGRKQDGSSERMMSQDKEKDVLDRLSDPPVSRNPDAVAPKTRIGQLLLRLASIFLFLKTPEGILALRSGVVSVALWIPSVCHSSAWFYYDNKGIWALIMAQTALATYAGDQIAAFILRFSGTILGLLIGMTVWYIGSGLGHGNPYGVVVASTVVLSPFLLARISAPPAQLTFWIMTSVTIVFVVGYSWINANQFVLANTGVGISIGWKRALLVIIGFTASLIVMLFPNPVSSRVLVRKTQAAVTAELGHIFSAEVEAFVAEERHARLSGDSKMEAKFIEQKKRRIKKIGERVIAVAERLRFIQPSLTTAKFEPQFAGTWPYALYEELFAIQVRLVGTVALLVVSFSKLDAKWSSALLYRTAYLNPHFLSDVFATTTILSNSLMGGHALPAQLPKLRNRLLYHEAHSSTRFLSPALLQLTRPQESDIPLQEHNGSQPSTANSNVNPDSPPLPEPIKQSDSNASSIMGLPLRELTLDTLSNDQLPAYSTAVVALASLIARIDEITEIVRTLCGQGTFQGFEVLHSDYLDHEERYVGSSRLPFAAR